MLLPQALLTSGQIRRGNPTFNFIWADSEGFDASDNTYYVEAQLSRSATGGQAGLAGFSIKKIVP